MEKLKKFKISTKNIIIAIFIIGIVIRTLYVLYTSVYTRQHDVFGDYGHIGYIQTIFETKKLPDNNTLQFYQQPLHHILAAGWLKVCSFLNINNEFNDGLEAIQILTLVYSILIMVFIYKILKELNIDDKYKILVMLMIAIHPTFIILTGSVNNDLLMNLFTYISILYLIKWNKEPSTKHTVILALSTALIALSKISGTIIAIPILYVFISKFIKEYKKTKDLKSVAKQYIWKYILFGVIALGLGLSFSIRNLILFKQSFFYVPTPGKDIYFGDKSILEILKAFPSELAQIYCNPTKNCNVFAYVIKNSLFGEFAMTGHNNTLSIILIVLNIILITTSLVSMFKVIKRKNVDEPTRQNQLMMFVFYLSEIFMFAYSIITKPYGCTMDFRYIVPTVFFGIMFIIYDIMNTKKHNKKYYIAFAIIEILFALSAIAFELVYMKYLTI